MITFLITFSWNNAQAPSFLSIFTSIKGSSPFLRIGHKMQDTVNSRVYGVFLCSKIEKGGKKGTPLINDEDVAL